MSKLTQRVAIKKIEQHTAEKIKERDEARLSKNPKVAQLQRNMNNVVERVKKEGIQ
jgi:hypothetical protein